MTHSNILISIVVPCYNQGMYLDECIKSVLSQSFTQWECIIVDDGSTDDTASIAKKWVDEYENITYYKNKNGGLSFSRNFGINKAKGTYILPLDADDTINPLYLEKAMETIEGTSNVGIVYCKAKKFGTVNKEWNLPDYEYESFLVHNCIFCSALFSKSDWKTIGGYDESMKAGFEDWEFWIRFISITKKDVVKLDYTGFNYRIKETSMVMDLYQDEERKMNTLEYINNKHSEIYDAVFPSRLTVIRQRQQLEKENKKLKEKLNKIRRLPLYKLLKKLMNVW